MMLKPVSILALDDLSAPLVAAVQHRVARTVGLEDLVQWRAVDRDDTTANQPVSSRPSGASGGIPSAHSLGDAIQSVHAQRQHPDSPLRIRDDVSTRELVLVVLAASGPARTTLLETLKSIRGHYESRRLVSYFTVEILCLLPEVTGQTTPADYAATYALLKEMSAIDEKPFDEVWLLDATNGARVKFGALSASIDPYADAIAGSLLNEPEMSGALPGIHPRGMHPTFSSFGYAELVFPRETALQRVEPRFAAELVRDKLLAGTAPSNMQLAAKQFVANDAFTTPLSRIGVDAGQSLFHRFQARARVTEQTRSADELIATVRNELKTFRDTTHLANLETLGKQAAQTSSDFAARLTRTVDETLDRDGYDTAIALLDALLDPLPDLRPDADLAPRNLITEIGVATSALDRQLQFAPNSASSDATRKRIRELETLIQDQKLVADSLAPVTAAEQLDAMEHEKATLLQRVPEILFAEERENNVARNAAREAEAARLASETEAREQSLRELFAQLPRAEQTLREALEMRRTWLWKQVLTAAAGVAAMYVLPFVFGLLQPNLGRINDAVLTGLIVFALFCTFRYFTRIMPLVTAAREALARLRAQIEAADQSKNAAYNDELRFEYDMAHRRATIRVLRETRDSAKLALDGVRARRQELEDVVTSLVPSSIAGGGLSIAIVDDAEVDAWYERTRDDRKPFVREFPLTRSMSRHLPLDDLRQRITSYTATAFEAFRKFTLADAAALVATEPKLTQRMKRFTDTSAPLVEVRDDDLQAQRAIQRDATLWADTHDATWVAQLQRRFPDAHVKPSAETLRVHALTRVLHYPAYVIGQIEYYRAHYESSTQRDGDAVADLLPPELILGTTVRTAYEQVLLARALGVISLQSDGQLMVSDALLGASNLAAAQALSESSPLRDQFEDALAPRLEIARNVTRDLRELEHAIVLTPLERNLIDALMKKCAE